jgi:hypothetical protein
VYAGFADDQSGSNRNAATGLGGIHAHFGTAPDRNNHLFQKIGKKSLARQETCDDEKRSPEERTQASQEHPRTFRSSDGMPISKERGRRYYVPGLPEAPQRLADPRGLA